MAILRCGETVFTDIEAVIFDKDGTLANVEAFLCRLANRRSQAVETGVPGIKAALLKAFGVEGDGLQSQYRLNPAGLMAVGSRQESAIVSAGYVAATGKDWAAALDLVREAFEAAEPSQFKAKQTPLLPGVLPLLQKLQAANLRLGILSSDRQTNVDDFVSTHGLSRYFRAAAGVQDNLSKADPRLVEQVFLKLNSNPAKTLMIGDSQIDIQLAAAFSMAGCVGFVGGWSSPPKLLNAAATIDRLEQIEVIEGAEGLEGI